jgi:hypothetical protein
MFIMKFKIPFHSFVDVITNSSTEIYVAATQKTVSMFREIIDYTLAVAGSNKKCDDLLKLSVENFCSCDRYGYSCSGDCESSLRTLVVEPVGEATPELQSLITRLNNLTGLFETGERYN